MEILTTEIQKIKSHIPTRLEILRELNKREALIHDEELQKELNRQERGIEGEEILLEHIQEVAPNHWIVLRNVWINYYGTFECDLVLITHDAVYLFEVKNYSGRFEIDQHVGKHGSKNVGNNVVSQALRMTINLREMLQNAVHDVNVIGVAAFVGGNNQVVVKDKVKGLKILGPNEVLDFIWSIRKNENQHVGYPIDSEKILQALAQYEIPPPYAPDKDISPEVFELVRGGIRCGCCGNFALATRKRHLDCTCGFIEPREEAIVRTICEYGVLNYRKNLRTSDLVRFFAGNVSRTTLYKYLAKHFEQIGNNRNAGFTNRGRPLSIIFNEFALTKDKYIRFNEPLP
jgi:hypothetical protein